MFEQQVQYTREPQLCAYAKSKYILGNPIQADFVYTNTTPIQFVMLVNQQPIYKCSTMEQMYIKIDRMRQGDDILTYEEADYKIVDVPVIEVVEPVIEEPKPKKPKPRKKKKNVESNESIC